MEMFPQFVAEGTRTYEVLLKPNINTYNLPDDPLLKGKKCFAIEVKSYGIYSRSGYNLMTDFYISLRNTKNQILIDNYPAILITNNVRTTLLFKEDEIDTMKSTIYIPPHVMATINSNPSTQYVVEIVLHYKA